MISGKIMQRTNPINWSARKGAAPLQISVVEISGGATPLR
jgi:hypothetical protein